MTDVSEDRPAQLTGGCLCGQVRFHVSGAPLFVAHCQCADCRKTSGTGHSTDAGFHRADLVIEGSLRTFGTQALSGNRIERSFCGVCGTKISTANAAFPEEIALNLAAFDNPEALVPTVVYFTKDSIDWDVVDPSLCAHETQP